MLAATDNFLYLKVSLKLMLWSHMPVCYYKFDITHESVFSSPSLLNEYLRYDKLWGPSQRVVTLFRYGHNINFLHFRPSASRGGALAYTGPSARSLVSMLAPAPLVALLDVLGLVSADSSCPGGNQIAS